MSDFGLPHVFMVGAFLLFRRPRADEVLAGAAPSTEDLDSQTANYYCRAEVRARIDVPCQLLECPNYINENRMHAGPPQQVRCRP